MNELNKTPDPAQEKPQEPVTENQQDSNAAVEPTPAEVVDAVDANTKNHELTEEAEYLQKHVADLDALEETPVVEEEEFHADELSTEQLVEELERTVEMMDVNAVRTRVALIKVAFIQKIKEEKERHFQSYLSDGGDKEAYQVEKNPLELRFNVAFDVYRKKRAAFNQQQEKLKEDNLAAKNAILEELRLLINSEETLKKTYDEFKALQERWKEIGLVPKTEVNNLWQSYHFLVEKFFDKVKINRELRDLDLKKNQEQKVSLCESAEELFLETSINKSFKALQELHKQWREVGPAPQDVKDELWERFKSATEKINQRRREHYNKLQEQQEGNLAAKLALCEKTEELLAGEFTAIKQWQETTEQMNELLKMWKTIGPAPKKKNDEVWERFKAYLDTFFANKKEFFMKLKEQQVNNYNLKLDLCVQVEAIKDSEDWKKTTQQLIEMQKEWKKIGPVPKKHSDKIWKRFRAACDEFFNRKSEFFAHIHQHEGENLKKKQALIEKAKAFELGTDKNSNLENLKGFQREWMEIGHVPIKEKDKIYNEFRSTINEKFEQLKISAIEMNTMNYKNKLANMAESQDGSKAMYRERNMLSNKLTKLKEDMQLWENNIGFLAESKNANLLKNEFMKKIDKAKNEILLLETKLKMLRETKS